MALNFIFTSNVAEWKASIREKQRPVREAAIAALRDVAAISVQEGRSDIASAGNFKGGWISGLQYRTSKTESLKARATIFHRYRIAGVFEYGAHIQGRPLLWIPTTRGAPSASRSGKKLVSATVKGTPVLFDAADKDRHRRPLYFGTSQVEIPDKFNVTEITEKNFENFGVFFYLHFKDET